MRFSEAPTLQKQRPRAFPATYRIYTRKERKNITNSSVPFPSWIAHQIVQAQCAKRVYEKIKTTA